MSVSNVCLISAQALGGSHLTFHVSRVGCNATTPHVELSEGSCETSSRGTRGAGPKLTPCHANWWCPQLCFLIYRMFIKGFINLYSLLTQCGSMFHDFSSQSRCIFQCRWQLFAGILDLQDSCSVAGLNESSLGTQLAARDQKQLCTWLQLIRSSPNEPESVDFLLKTRVKTLTVLKR